MSTAALAPRPIANPSRKREELVFPHPSEAEFARVLDFFGIEWRYEPMTFPLKWDEQGHILEAFSPDFYLVQQDLYVELTTLRAKLMRLKHQKIKLIKELYPDVNVKLWSRRDFDRFLERFGLEERRQELVGKEAVRSAHG
jgi:hypothetical protein